MSSATSTETHNADQGLRPWQFFLLAGMLAATAVVLVSAGQSVASIIVLSLTVVSASFVALGAYRSLAPLVSAEGAEPPPMIVGQTRAALEREKALTLRAIKELEFDYAMKKIAKSDFDEVSARLRARAIGLMRQLDSGGGYRDSIERELSQRLALPTTESPGAGLPAAASPDNNSDAPPVAAATAQDASSGASGAACVCGTVNDPDARFCKNCGAKLAAVSHA